MKLKNELKLLKPGSISGRVVLELPKSSEGCSHPNNSSIKEISLQIKKTGVHVRNFSFLPYGHNEEVYLTTPNDKGDFVQKNIEKGHYRIAPDLPDETWYIRAINRGIKGIPQKKIDLIKIKMYLFVVCKSESNRPKSFEFSLIQFDAFAFDRPHATGPRLP